MYGFDEGINEFGGGYGYFDSAGNFDPFGRLNPETAELFWSTARNYSPMTTQTGDSSMYFPGAETLIASGISGGINLLQNLFGGGAPSTDEQLTAIVDAAERLLKANLAQFEQGSISASQGVSTAWSLMNQMVSKCLAYGTRGQNAAAERDRRIDPSLVRWDWIAWYIDPITGGVSQPQPLPAGAGSGAGAGYGSGFTNTGTTNYTRPADNTLLYAGLALVAVVLISRSK